MMSKFIIADSMGNQFSLVGEEAESCIRTLKGAMEHPERTPRATYNGEPTIDRNPDLKRLEKLKEGSSNE